LSVRIFVETLLEILDILSDHRLEAVLVAELLAHTTNFEPEGAKYPFIAGNHFEKTRAIRSRALWPQGS